MSLCRLARKLPMLFLGLLLLHGPAAADPPQSVMDMRDFAWRQGGLRETHFGDREIIEDESIVVLEAPGRAEDGSRVPIKIKAQIPQTEDRYIETISLFIDANPVPLAGQFNFTPKSGQADLRLRVRVNDYSAIRAVAETNDGQLHMSTRFVKAAGGCSAPIPPDIDSALSRLGKMKIRTRTEASAVEPIPAFLNISHPNITGMQANPVTKEYLPPHFVSEVTITFNGDVVLQAETGITISQDPSIGFYFVPDRAGALRVDVTDSDGNQFSKVHQLGMMN